MPNMQKEHYYHFRSYNQNGSLNVKGGATVCYLPAELENLAWWGVALCSADDNFSKCEGRRVARNHALMARGTGCCGDSEKMDMSAGYDYAVILVETTIAAVLEEKKYVYESVINRLIDDFDNAAAVMEAINLEPDKLTD